MISINPYPEENKSKKQQIASMFNRISGRYDLLNRCLSFSIDQQWRKKALKAFDYTPVHLLDIATGTGDFALMAYTKLKPHKITGIDIADNMLALARRKVPPHFPIEFIHADAENLPFPDSSIDAVTVAFGIRNFENLNKGLQEIYRVLEPGKKLVIIEFSMPETSLVRRIYLMYFRYLLPWIGGIISGDYRAYRYLYESVQAFPYGQDLIEILQQNGFKNVHFTSLSFGIATLYVADK